eukprot:3552245-Rhodomonas_salina.1
MSAERVLASERGSARAEFGKSEGGDGGGGRTWRGRGRRCGKFCSHRGGGEQRNKESKCGRAGGREEGLGSG